jgi:hypothetical protein
MGSKKVKVDVMFAFPVERKYQKPKKKSKLGYYLFCIKWLWKNREWENTRQKFKAMEKAIKERF